LIRNFRNEIYILNTNKTSMRTAVLPFCCTDGQCCPKQGSDRGQQDSSFRVKCEGRGTGNAAIDLLENMLNKILSCSVPHTGSIFEPMFLLINTTALNSQQLPKLEQSAICGSCSSNYWNYSSLQCGVTLFDRKVPTFQKKKLLPQPSGSSSAKLEGSKLYVSNKTNVSRSTEIANHNQERTTA
jgi:hypothetical protein